MAKKSVSKTLLTGVAVVAVVAFLMYSGMQGITAVECELCIVYNGRTVCKTAQGSSREEARRTAVSNACAELTGGMTELIACENTEPKSIEYR